MDSPKYLILSSNESGNPVRWLTQEQLDDMLKNPDAEKAIKFCDEKLVDDEPNPRAWKRQHDSPDGKMEVVLLRIEFLKPKVKEIVKEYTLE